MGWGIGRLWFEGTRASANDGPWPRVRPDEPAGVFRVRDPRVFQAGRRMFCQRWLSAAVRRGGVRKARVDLATATALIEFEPGAASTAAMAAAFSGAVHEAIAARTEDTVDRTDWVVLTAFAGVDSPVWEVSGRSWDQAGSARTTREHAGSLVPANRLARYANLARAAGCFALTIVGLVVPGIPTFPFLLATGYYLARSSPRLNRALQRSAFFGPVLRDWETHRALRPSSKARLIGLAAAIVVVTVLVTPMSPVVFIVVVVVSLVGIYQIVRLPGVPAEPGEVVHEAPALAFAPG